MIAFNEMKWFWNWITIYIFTNIKVKLLMDAKNQNLWYLKTQIVSD